MSLLLPDKEVKATLAQINTTLMSVQAFAEEAKAALADVRQILAALKGASK